MTKVGNTIYVFRKVVKEICLEQCYRSLPLSFPSKINQLLPRIAAYSRIRCQRTYVNKFRPPFSLDEVSIPQTAVWFLKHGSEKLTCFQLDVQKMSLDSLLHLLLANNLAWRKTVNGHT